LTLVSLAVFITKCTLTIALTSLLIALDWRRICRTAGLYNSLLEISKEDAITALNSIRMFGAYTAGVPSKPIEVEEDAVTFKSPRGFSCTISKNTSMVGSSSLGLSNRTESFSPLETNHRIRIVTTNAATEHDSP
jgi:hypothetical protein